MNRVFLIKTVDGGTFLLQRYDTPISEIVREIKNYIETGEFIPCEKEDDGSSAYVNPAYVTSFYERKEL